ncbi:MAG: DUF4870 domain-containing protein [Chloroflexota bacterium]|nr:DUF4870 domain-containing protein [Chloroflexota bacterium]
MMRSETETQQPEITSDEKTFALISHLAPLATGVVAVGHIILPLLILLLKGKESKFVEDHARESLNFQITITIYWIVTILLMFVLVGFLLAINLVIMQIVFMIKAMLKAGNGEQYRYPLCIRFVK